MNVKLSKSGLPLQIHSLNSLLCKSLFINYFYLINPSFLRSCLQVMPYSLNVHLHYFFPNSSFLTPGSYLQWHSHVTHWTILFCSFSQLSQHIDQAITVLEVQQMSSFTQWTLTWAQKSIRHRGGTNKLDFFYWSIFVCRV